MTRKQSFFILFLFFLSILFFVYFLLYSISQSDIQRLFLVWKQNIFSSHLPINEEKAKVKRVIDGDTIELENGEKVRYIGINTPESVDPRKKVECFGKEAMMYNKNLVEGKEVSLVRDVSDRDVYGRLLRFVYLNDGIFINEILVKEGYAFVSSYPPDTSKQDIFRKAEATARNEGRGLWNSTTCRGKK